MVDLTVACVRTGDKYAPEYVYRLKAMVERHLSFPHHFVCLTDKPSELPELLQHETLDISSFGLQKWWGKMAIFMAGWRDTPLVYLDLDTVIVDQITPLAIAASTKQFIICANFTRAAGNFNWPCKYGSCVMTLGRDFGAEIWSDFWMNHKALIEEAGKYGDQQVIEKLYPDALMLQDYTPPGFFTGYRDLKETRPRYTAVVVFAGSHKPENTSYQWVREQWTR